jgi:subtilisin family serine protease
MTLPSEFESAGPVPERLLGYVSVASQGGLSAFEAEEAAGLEPFFGTTDDHDEAARALEASGLEIIAESRLGKSVVGPPGAYEELTGGTLVTCERLLHAEAGRERYVTHVDIVGKGQPEALGLGAPASKTAKVEGVLLERPRILHGIFPAPIPPTVQKFHLRVPDDVAVAVGAMNAHRQGHAGQGVTVAMVDSGQFAHPFFVAHGYDVKPPVAVVPGASPTKDPVGHGTGESANIFAIAPGATLRPYRASNEQGQLVGAIAGFLRAKGDKPNVLTNSWGGDGPFPPAGPPDPSERAWALEIRDAVEQGIVVVFSAGNGQFSIEPQVPGVLSAGGVFADAGLDLRASNYASAYESPWFDGVSVPVVCGLVGLLPRAQYLLLPIQPGSQIDVMESQSENGDPPDGTTASDGWALFSGTSAAAPLVAGASALLLGAKPNITPASVRDALFTTATDVLAGRCNPRFNLAAGPGPDVATGAGLVNVSAALQHVLG